MVFIWVMGAILRVGAVCKCGVGGGEIISEGVLS